MSSGMLTAVEAWVRLATVRPRYWLDDKLYRMRGLSRELERFRGIHAGKPMLVVGNGPSLNRTPLDRFDGIPAIGMNKINLLFPRTTWRPSCIISLNNLVVSQNREFFESWDSPVFIAFKARWFVDARRNPNLCYFNISTGSDFSTDFSQTTGQATTVSYAALQLAYYMGANPVIIFGIDHRFSYEGKPRRTNELMTTDDPNHFDPNYFKGQKWGLPDLGNDRRLFTAAREAFARDGRQILDATVDGALTIFPRLTVEEALQRCGLPSAAAGPSGGAAE